MKHSIHGPEWFQQETNVSRETLDRLKAYADLLVKWNAATNLVGRSTIQDLWRRHMLDSAQLLPLIPDLQRTLVDIGSGAGFPGLVLAILGAKNVHLVEADHKKASFLREAARISGVSPIIHAQRIESLKDLKADIITARALAPVAELLSVTTNIASKSTIFVLLKGRNVGDELTEAHKMWRMVVEKHPSASDSAGSIVVLREVHHVSSDDSGPNHS